MDLDRTAAYPNPGGEDWILLSIFRGAMHDAAARPAETEEQRHRRKQECKDGPIKSSDQDRHSADAVRITAGRVLRLYRAYPLCLAQQTQVPLRSTGSSSQPSG